MSTFSQDNTASQSSSHTEGVYVNVEDLLNFRHITKDLVLETRKKSIALVDGDSQSRFRGRGMEFSEVRPYQAGDDIRNIDWRVTARTQQPYTKLFQEEKERPVYLMVDQRSPMFFGSVKVFKSVYAAQLAAIIAWTALQNNDRIGALIFSDEDQIDTRAKRGKHALLSLLHHLHQYNTQLSKPIATPNIKPLSEMLTDTRRVVKPGSLVYLISDFHDFDENSNEPLSILARHTNVTLVQLFDKLEKTLPTTNNLSVTDCTKKITLTGQIKAFAENYHRAFKTNSENIQNACRNAGVSYARVQIDTPIETLAKDLFVSKVRSRRTR